MPCGTGAALRLLKLEGQSPLCPTLCRQSEREDGQAFRDVFEKHMGARYRAVVYGISGKMRAVPRRGVLHLG